MRLLAVGVALTLLLVALVSWRAWTAYSALDTVMEALKRHEDLDAVTRFDQELTVSARVAAIGALASVVILLCVWPAGLVLVRRHLAGRHRAEKALRASQAKYKELYDTAPDMFCSADVSTGRILKCNATLASSLGYSQEEIVGRHFSELYPPEAQAHAERVLQSFLQIGEVQDAELVLVCRDGRRVDVSLNMSAVRDGDGRILSGTCIFRGIGERKRTERKIRELNDRLERRVAARTAELRVSEAKWRSLVENAPDIVMTVGRDGTILFLNKTVTEERRPQDVIGTSVYDYAPEDGKSQLRSILERVFSTGETVSFELAGPGPRGVLAWYRMRLAPIRHSGQTRAAVLISRDVTARRRVEEELRSKTEQLEAVTEAMTQFVDSGDWRAVSSGILGAALRQTESECGFLGVVIEGPNGRVLRVLAQEGVIWDRFVSRTIYEQARRSYEAVGYLEFANFDTLFGHVIISGTPVVANDPRDDRASDLPAGDPPLREFLGVPIHRTGVVVGLIAVANRQGGYSGTEVAKMEILTQTAGVLYDSYRRAQHEAELQVQREQAVQALRESEERFREMAETVPEIFWLYEGDFSRVIYVSPAYESITGRSRQSLYDDPWSWEETVHSEDRSRLRHAIAGLVRGEEVEGEEYRIVHPDGSIRWARAQGFPIRDEDGRAVRIVGLTEDITERKAAEEEAHRHRATLAHVLRVETMGEMAAQLAHEIGQPLGAIANFAHGLLARIEGAEEPKKEARQAGEWIAREALRAGEIIRRIRKFQKKGDPERTPGDVNALVREVASLLAPQARSSEVALHLDLHAGLPPVNMDAIQIEQVLVNLMRNGIDAIAESPNGKRELQVRTVLGHSGTVNVVVQDTGVGLPAGGEASVFDPFFTTKVTGLGMGLCIARSIVHAHGGQLWASANENGGATFQFALPIAVSNLADAS